MDAIEIIRKSEHFVAQWYLEQYPDVAVSGMDAAVHYCKYGWVLGRDPGPDFSISNYISKNPICQEKNINPLLHSILGDVAELTALSEASRSNGIDNVASRHYRIDAQLQETQKLLECYYSKYQDLEIEKLYGKK